MIHETFLSLLRDRAHWEFEIFGQLLFDIFLGAIIYPWASKHIRHHMAHDKKDAAADIGGFDAVKYRWMWGTDRDHLKPMDVGKTADICGKKQKCVAEGDISKRSDGRTVQFYEYDGTPIGETEMAKPKAKMNVTQGAEIISDATDAVSIDLAVETSIKVAHNLSSDVRFNLAAYLKYDMGSNLKGMDDQGWLDSAESILKVVSSR